MTNSHCRLFLQHDMCPRPRGKKVSLGGGVPLIGLPPQQLHSHDTTGALGHVYKETPYPSPIYSNSVPEKCLKIFFKDVILEENLKFYQEVFKNCFQCQLCHLSASQQIKK